MVIDTMVLITWGSYTEDHASEDFLLHIKSCPPENLLMIAALPKIPHNFLFPPSSAVLIPRGKKMSTIMKKSNAFETNSLDKENSLLLIDTNLFLCSHQLDIYVMCALSWYKESISCK